MEAEELEGCLWMPRVSFGASAIAGRIVSLANRIH
jgi:hypothetical protein